MLTEQQRAHYDAFGFVVLRRLFSSDEMDAIGREFDDVLDEDRQGQAFTGERRQYVSGFVEKRELLTRLVDDDRIYLAAEAVLGPEFMWMTSDGNLYIGDTDWHTDARQRGIDRTKVALYLDPVSRGSGCLRVVPGSHRPPLQGALWEGLSVADKGEAPVTKPYGVEGRDLPDYALESDPGDVVLFDQFLFHASFGGKTGRRMLALSFFEKPTADEHVSYLQSLYQSIVTANIPEGQHTPTDRLYTDEFFNTDRPRIQRFVYQLKELGFR